MKTKTISTAVVLSFIILTSFTDSKSILKLNKDKPAFKSKTCTVWCEFKPSTSNFTITGFWDCCEEDNRINTSGYVATIDHTGGTVDVSASVGTSHAAGTITIKRNGTTVDTQSVPANTAGSISKSYSGVSCGESFQVTW